MYQNRMSEVTTGICGNPKFLTLSDRSLSFALLFFALQFALIMYYVTRRVTQAFDSMWIRAWFESAAKHCVHLHIHLTNR